MVSHPLTQCKLISKQWNSTISHPNFILHHFNNIICSHPFTPLESLFIQSGNSFYLYSCANQDYDDVDYVAENNLIRLVGCSNGLVCFGGRNGKYFYLYNPKTNQSHKYYPGDSDFWKSNWSKPITCWGFGYVSSIDDYKVVSIIPYWNGKVAMVHVFSLRSNIWLKLEIDLEEGDFIISQARLVNETLYWRICGGRIVAFDLAREIFEFFPHLGISRGVKNELCVMGGCLSKVQILKKISFEPLTIPFFCHIHIVSTVHKKKKKKKNHASLVQYT
ncbi:F-box/kelch-repeat protein At3g23880-like [Chenopodium quinoa]|uniref:F-box/kelch-repeat protein At3g23880-like n=1 Tax=Chenopodium quinoa TaxID=63459 RepID=UPI000B76C727|nr:F-box/kelch-repeat protein At3g23880-like [Chenopodium quinoa]